MTLTITLARGGGRNEEATAPKKEREKVRIDIPGVQGPKNSVWHLWAVVRKRICRQSSSWGKLKAKEKKADARGRRRAVWHTWLLVV